MGNVSSAIIDCNASGCATAGARAYYRLHDLDSHDVKIGMRWLLDAPPAPVAPAPLVRKG